MQAKQRPSANAAVPVAPSQLHQMTGYLAIVGMSRLQCLLGDYYECENRIRTGATGGGFCSHPMDRDVFAGTRK